ncbi:MAG: hypothetical protein WC636_05205 [Candidatus Margulisiibacteriota bacterium]
MIKPTYKELEIIGAILYSCEGTRLRIDKRRKNKTFYWAIEFTNSNPKLIKLFILFLNKCIIIDKNRLKGQLFIYNDLNINKLEKYWSRISKIPLKYLNKTIIFKAKNVKYKPNPIGTFKVRYHSKVAFTRLAQIIKKVIGE